MIRALLVAAAGVVACAPADRDWQSPGDGGGDGPIAFEARGEHALDDHGKTHGITIPVGRGQGTLEIRVGPSESSDAPPACYQLDDVRDAEGRVWVPPAETQADWGPHCTTCAQRVSVGHGYGLFVFPNNGDALPDVDDVSIRVGVRDCGTGLPVDAALGAAIPPSVRVESRTLPPPPPAARGRVDLFFAFAEGTQFRAEAAGHDGGDPQTPSEDAVLRQARSSVQAAFDEANIDVRVTGHASFDAGPPPLAWSDADRAPLDAAYRRAAEARAAAGGDPSSLLVVFAPCLIRRDTLSGAPSQLDGLTANLPAGDGLGGHADGIFLKAAGCGAGASTTYWLDGALLGKVLAHEIGHALGLYHTVEALGGLDHLDDTTAENLMNRAPLLPSSKGLSPRQIRVVRGSPRVLYEQ